MTLRRPPRTSAEQTNLPAGAGPRRRTILGLATLCASLAALALTTTPASALTTHTFSSSFGSEGTGDGQLRMLRRGNGAPGSQLAVDDATGDVYVADTANHRVDQFSASGGFIRTWGWGVKDGTSEYQTCTANCSEGIPGSKPGQLSLPTFIAVDNSGGPSSGDVYVGDVANDVVQKFTAEGAVVASWGDSNAAGSAPKGILDGSSDVAKGPFGLLAGIAVDSSGRLYVYAEVKGTLKGPMYKFEQAGTFIEDFQPEALIGNAGMAVDSAGYLYVFGYESSGVLKLSPTGAVLGAVNPQNGLWNIVAGVATAGTNVFIASLQPRSVIFDPSCEPSGFGGCEPEDAFGSLEPAGGELGGPTNEFHGSPTALAVAASGKVYVADPILGRIDIFDPVAVPNAATKPATGPGTNSATLHGHLDPAGNGEVTGCHFEYLPETAYNENFYERSQRTGGQVFTDLSSGGTVPCAEGQSFSGPADVHADVAGLDTNTNYFFRLVAENANGSRGELSGTKFSTLGSVNVSTGQAEPVGVGTATLNGEVDPNGHSEITNCHFEYLPASVFVQHHNYSSGATSIPCDQPTPISSATPVTGSLTGLEAGTEFNYRLVAVNAEGRTVGSTGSFVTISHIFSHTFSGSGTNQLSGPTDVAIDQTTGDVYVTDPGHHRVEKFDANGNFVLMFGKEVDKTKVESNAPDVEQDVCTAASGDVCQPGIAAGTNGAPIGGFDQPTYLAVDNSFGPSAGDVYVSDTAAKLVQKFTSAGALVTSWGDSTTNAPAPNGQLDLSSDKDDAPPLYQIGGVAVDSVGNLWVDGRDTRPGSFAAHLYEVDQAGTFLFSFSDLFAGQPNFSMSIDPAGNLAIPYFAGFVLFTPEGHSTQIPTPFGGLGGGGGFGVAGVSVDPANGDYFTDESGSQIGRFPSCQVGCARREEFGAGHLSSAHGLGVKQSSGDVYVANTDENDVAVFAGVLPLLSTGSAAASHATATVNGHLDPGGRGEVASCHFQYVTEAAFRITGFEDLSSGGSVPCAEGQSFAGPADVHADLSGLQVETTYRYRLTVANAVGTAVGLGRTVRTHAVTDLTTEAATEITNSSATLHGSFTAEPGLETHYFFEYGTTTEYGHKEPVPPGVIPGIASGTQQLSTPVGTSGTALAPGTTYHFRIIAENSLGTSNGQDLAFTTDRSPTIESISSAEVTATSALLIARINPQNFPTAYRFEYGPTAELGQTVPVPDGEISTNLAVPHIVTARITSLQRGATYHFRVFASNEWGSVSTEDQTFEFFPPGCPNSEVRQQTGSVFLPDCRGYELVSPRNANGTLLYSGGPTSPSATSPSRFAFTGAFSAIPEAPNTIGGDGDLYVSTRTNSGWDSHYVGLPGDRTGCMGGPPTSPESYAVGIDKIQDWVLTDSSMSKFLSFDLGAGDTCFFSGNGTSDASQELDVASNAPYLWSAKGEQLSRLPTSLKSDLGAEADFECPVAPGIGHFRYCNGEVTASADFSHFVFSSRTRSYAEPGAPAGLTEAPGSAYVDNLETGKVTLISTLRGGGEIHQDSSFSSSRYFCSTPTEGQGPPCPNQEFIRFPGISNDGSHVLMSTATAPTPFCRRANIKAVCPRFTDTPVHLYMSVDDEPAFEISKSEVTHEGLGVDYVGMTPDGSKVFFTSERHLTGDDLNHGGASLYVWSEKGEEEGRPLTLISKANPGSPDEAGDTEHCSPVPTAKFDEGGASLGKSPWTEECGIVTYSGWSYANGNGGAGGNGFSDSGLAANGDIYFYSPEQLDGDRGVPNQQNLYLYRNGQLQYVTTLNPAHHCQTELFGEKICSDGPIVRLQVTPDDAHLAFVTEDRLTSYDNAGHLEMYSYTPSSGNLVCDSCNPSGKPATADVAGSQNGLFLTEDGRAFFSTSESLVPRDTNRGIDVYEFTEGRPHLITPGTGTASVTGESSLSSLERPGLIGVSTNGTDVYFSTYDSLLPEDHNGNFLKFYDARSNGGFAQPPPLQPCAAAEECHGPGTEAPILPTQGSAAELSGGNRPRSLRHHKRKHKKARGRRHHRHAGHRHGRNG